MASYQTPSSNPSKHSNNNSERRYGADFVNLFPNHHCSIRNHTLKLQKILIYRFPNIRSQSKYIHSAVAGSCSDFVSLATPNHLVDGLLVLVDFHACDWTLQTSFNVVTKRNLAIFVQIPQMIRAISNSLTKQRWMYWRPFDIVYVIIGVLKCQERRYGSRIGGCICGLC